MTELPDQLDVRIVYLCMLNATECSPLSDLIADLVWREIVEVPKSLDAARQGVRYLISNGWATLSEGDPYLDSQSLAEESVPEIIVRDSAWRAQGNGEQRPPSLIFLEATPAGIAAWGEGFPVVKLTESERQSLMFPPISRDRDLSSRKASRGSDYGRPDTGGGPAHNNRLQPTTGFAGGG